MRFDRKDIEAVAKSRVSRAEGNKSTYWTVGAMVALVTGVFLQGYSPMIGWVLVLGGFISFVWYMNALGKKQNAYKIKLVKEWMQEVQQQEGK